MSLLPRVRLALARRPWLYWLCVGVCAAVVWFSVAAAQARVVAARDSWGATRTVWVASGEVGAGEAVVARPREYPVAMVPAAALTSLTADAVAARSIGAGEVLVADDLAGDSLAPPGWVVFAVPADAAPTLAVLDRVVVFGSGHRWCDGVVVASAEIETEVVEVAVASECAADLSAQLALGAVTLARLS
ncbi:MAG: hypothetical protein Q8M22_00110 [Actinomycetota bacterium]|nr:hypothetical protein [Actinomycetota bacterium]